MACSKPRTAYLTTDNKVAMSPKGADISRPLYLPCNKCALCLRARKRDLMSRLVMEAWSHADSICATFTYSDEHLPPGGGLSKRDAQLLVKRLREYLFRHHKLKIRAHVCGEYSPTKLRPHLHVIVFGWWPSDAVACGLSQKARNPEFTSEALTSLWGKGRVTFQRFTPAAGAYVAKHQASKLRHKGAAELAHLQPDGTWSFLPPEFELRPLRPGLGAAFFERHQAQLLAHDFVVINGKQQPLPKYFNTLADRVAPDRLSELKAARALYASDPARVADASYERLAVREVCAVAQDNHYNQAGALDG